MIFDIENLSNFALTGHTSVHNENGLTAQQLLIKSSKKVKECLNTVQNVYNAVEKAMINSGLEYDSTVEEIAVANSVIVRIENANNYVDKFYYLFNENSTSQIELAGNISNAINEGLKVVSELATRLIDLDGNTEVSAKELIAFVDSAYIDVYDECAMNLLELAGITANCVNDLIKAVNTLYVLAGTINGGTLADSYYDETLTTLLNESEDETLEI